MPDSSLQGWLVPRDRIAPVLARLDQDRRRFMTPSRPGDPHYVFALVARPDFLSYEDYREHRGAYFEACARVLKVEFPDALDIVGVLMESGLDTPN